MRALALVASVFVWIVVTVFAVSAQGQRAGQSNSWTIPANGAAEKSPLTVNDEVLAKGKQLYSSKCSRCHGPAGKGDGPDGDPEHQEDMDLTLKARAVRNTDGTVFYKLWNGRAQPKMPAFSAEITKEQAWAIVAYVQTLRAK